VLLQAADDEAQRIDGSNRAVANIADEMIARGEKVVPGPYHDRLRRAAELRAIARLIGLINGNAGLKDALRRAAGNG
jgi:hypothetical protein